MNYKDALKQCHKVGTANATGDALRAMYANMINDRHVLNCPERLFLELRSVDSDAEIATTGQALMREPGKALAVVLQCERCPNPYSRTVKTRFARERLCQPCITNYQIDNPGITL